MSDVEGILNISGVVDKELISDEIICEEIPSELRSFTIEPLLPSGLIFDENKCFIKGIMTEKYSGNHKIIITGGKGKIIYDINIKILRTLPYDSSKMAVDGASDGTSLGHGVSEFIDNAIDAGAKNITIKMGFEQFENSDQSQDVFRPWLIVEDDGAAILDSKIKDVTIDSLTSALGFASSPDAIYEDWRLGAYGVGLPTAIISSANFGTVFTKKNGKIIVGHISVVDMKRYDDLRFFDEEDIADYLKECKSYKQARKLIDEKKGSGTVILLQDHYQIRMAIEDFHGETKNHKFKTQLNVIKTRLKSYLGLIYHKFLEKDGIILKNSLGEEINRKINLELSGKIHSLDPLMEHCDSKKIKNKKGTHIQTFSNGVCTILGEKKYFTVKMAILPGLRTKKDGGYGRRTPEGDSFDEKMSEAWMVYNSMEGSDATPSPKELQGLYLYRNMRLIQFGDWGGIKKINASHQVCRAAVYTPNGLPKINLGGDGMNDFSVDQRKRKMKLTMNIQNEIGTIFNMKMLWNSEDPKKHDFTARAAQRGAYDGGSGTTSKKKKKVSSPPLDAAMEPSVALKKTAPCNYDFKDNTPGLNSKKSIYEWKLDGKLISSDKECSISIDKAGEYMITLDIKNGKKKYQCSQKITTLPTHDSSKNHDEPIPIKEPNYWDVETRDFDSTAAPIVLEGNTYFLNGKSPKLKQILKMIQVLHKDGDLIG